MASSYRLDRLRRFVTDFAHLLDKDPEEDLLLVTGDLLLRGLVAHDDWLPAVFAEPDPARYRQFLLHCDSAERFSVVSFVWGPGQSTPIHDHTVWGLVGVLRGAELSQRFERAGDGALTPGAIERLETGQVETLSPAAGDIHQVSNAYPDRTSISIHVYGGNIGAVRRSTFDLAGQARPFISGYSNTLIPNMWDAQANQAVISNVAAGS
jgi:predicted metal-dependent enzyme (double-stranded beta helix superfamily)